MDGRTLLLALAWLSAQGLFAYLHSRTARRVEAAADRLAGLQPGTIELDVDAAAEKFGPVLLEAAAKLAAKPETGGGGR